MRRQLITVSTLTAIAQGAGFLKLWLTARLFGVGPELDGYFLALVAPTLVSGALSGMLQTALFPVRAHLAATRAREIVERFERGVLAGLLVLGLAMAALILLAGTTLLARVGGSVAPSVLEAASFVLPFAALLVPLNAVGDGMGYLLAMRDRYPIAAAAPIANALLGAGLLAAWPEGGLLNLAVGTVAGVALQVAICAWALDHTGFSIISELPSRDELAAEWRQMLGLSVWILPGVVFSNLSAALPTVLIAPYGEGAVSAFGYAWRIHSAALQLLILAVSPVLLARFSNLVARRDHEMVTRLIRKAAWFSLLVEITALVFVWSAGEYLLHVLFGMRFDAGTASRVASQWFWLTAGLGFLVFGGALARYWQSAAHARLLSLFSLVQLISIIIAFNATRSFGEQSVSISVAVSSAVVIIVNMFFLFLKTHSKRIRPYSS